MVLTKKKLRSQTKPTGAEDDEEVVPKAMPDLKLTDE